MTRQFLQFCVAGTLGLAADVAALELLTHGLGLGPYGARVLSFLIAVTVTWAYNRRYTFQPRPGETLTREWLRYAMANAVGGLVNYGAYALLVHQFTQVRQWLWLGVAAGSLAGLIFNFSANKYYVYRAHGPD